MIVVYTAALGETDTVRPPAMVDPDVRYLCFSDRPCVAPYEHIATETTEQPQLAARRLKILADHPILRAADLVLWHDASYRLLRRFGWLVRGLTEADVVAMRHPRRVRIEDEAAVIAKYGYVTDGEAAAIVAGYRAQGFSDQVLTATGLLGRRPTKAVAAFNAIWWSEAQRWNGRDQASMDYAAWMAPVRVAHVPGTVRNNKYAAWRDRVAA